MNPVESIQNKTNKVTEEITKKIKREVAQIILKKTQPLISVLLWVIFFLIFLVTGILSTLGLFIFKSITDWNGNISYGSVMLGCLISFVFSMLIAILSKGFLARKINNMKKELMDELE